MDVVKLVAGGALALAAALGKAPRNPAMPAPPPVVAGHPGKAVTDRWSADIADAARRFEVAPNWIRRVIRVESGGHAVLDGAPITSPAGAMGLMQVMPGTYAAMRQRYGLGNDPYDPRDNILAGTAYLRQMYDRFGSPGFLAAYNAGPARYRDYLDGTLPLPNETSRFVARVDSDSAPPPPQHDGNTAAGSGLFAGASTAAQDGSATSWRRIFFVLGSVSPRESRMSGRTAPIRSPAAENARDRPRR
jgi:soluble lytic murein transglycosylase-like protein